MPNVKQYLRSEDLAVKFVDRDYKLGISTARSLQLDLYGDLLDIDVPREFELFFSDSFFEISEHSKAKLKAYRLRKE